MAAVGDEDEGVRVAVVQVAGLQDDGAAAGRDDVRADAALDERPQALVGRLRRPAELGPRVPDPSDVPVAGFVTVPSSRM